MATISGTVKDSAGSFARRIVRAYRQDTGGLVAEALSNPTTGAFSLTTADATKHFVVVHDSDSWITYLPMNGANNSTTFTEWSGKVVTPFGGAKISTAQSKFGGASAVFDGAGDYLTLPSSKDLDFGASDFTIEFFVRFSSVAGNQGVFSTKTSTGFSSVLFFLIGGDLCFYSSKNGTSWDVALATVIKAGVAIDTWYHISACREGGSIRLFADGVLATTVTVSGALVALGADTPSVGQWAGSNYLNGYIDDLSVEKFKARRTSGFTPPASAFSPPSNVKNAMIYDLLTPV